MTGIEYMNTVCPTTSAGRDPSREDVADAFEDGIAEGYKLHWKPSKEQIEYLSKAILTLGEEGDCRTAAVLNELRKDLKNL